MSEENGSEKMGRNWLFAALPLIVFLALAGIFYKQLAAGGASSDLPSALIGRDAPKSDLPPLVGLLDGGIQVPSFSGDLYSGHVSLINVWASWCAPCREEHPLLVELGKQNKVQIIGLNYKDKQENAIRFLGQLGNPYDAVGVDSNGRAAIEWGVYGVPETFVVGPDGKIIHKHVGPLNPRVLQETILPIIEKAKSGISS
jgi:cytochrome c biogenesis protein CcmG/thiol:disulfide interchange protein DsbE